MNEKTRGDRPDRDRRVRQADRMARVLGALWRIQSRGHWNAAKLADDLDCSVRTVHRDLDVLSYAGVPWYFDREADCYRVRGGAKFPTLPLTDAEAFGQATAEMLGRIPGLNVTAGAEPTNRKLATADDEAARKLEDARRITEAANLHFADCAGCGPLAETVRAALAGGVRLRGRYRSPFEEEETTLDLHPKRLCLLGRAWYVVGRNEGEEAPKTYRLSRFRSLRASDEPAEESADFDLSKYLGDAWAVYRGGETEEVEVWCPAAGADAVTETTWHRTQTLTRHPDGSATLRFRVAGLVEVADWVLSQTPKVRAVAPETLKQRVTDLLERGLELHAAEAASPACVKKRNDRLRD